MHTRCLSCGNSIEGVAQICDACKAKRQAAAASKAEAQQASTTPPKTPDPARQPTAGPPATTSGRTADVMVVGGVGVLLAGLVVWLFALGGAATIGLAGDDSPAVVFENPTPTPAGPLAPIGYEASKCTFEMPAGETAECGILTVPQSRAEPDRGRVRLPVAVIRSTSPNRQPDAVIYLDGGPGGDTLDGMPYVYEGVKLVAPDRDVVLFDQRGAGGSTPSLDCPEVNEVNYELLVQSLTMEQRLVEDAAAVKTCRDRLTKAGVDPSLATSAENAADVNDLRLALGYEQWNLFGVSYGTKLALTIMRDHPDGLRSVILDSTYPLQSDLFGELQTNFDRGLSAMFAACAADPICSVAYPDLEAAFYETVDRLNQSPIQFGVDVQGRTDISAKVDGTWFSSFVFSAMYIEDLVALLPLMIYETRAGEYGLMDVFIDGWFQDMEGFSVGMYYSVQCGEEMPFALREAIIGAAKGHPRLAQYSEYSARSLFASCDTWQAPPSDGSANTAVQSAIPTLLLTGEFDPITPPAWGHMVAGNLANSFIFDIPAIGHGAVFSDDCPASIAEAFINNPLQDPPSGCISAMSGLEWVVY